MSTTLPAAPEIDFPALLMELGLREEQLRARYGDAWAALIVFTTDNHSYVHDFDRHHPPCRYLDSTKGREAPGKASELATAADSNGKAVTPGPGQAEAAPNSPERCRLKFERVQQFKGSPFIPGRDA